ncbi:MAG: DNA polymerase III subunit alpha [Planctomycetia bacterium]|nr:DNA polymerase III subunit alpha [Planctomycetia bacterium]
MSSMEEEYLEEDFDLEEEEIEEESQESDSSESGVSADQEKGSAGSAGSVPDDTVPFVHFHVHSHYSLLDGAGKIDALIARAKDLNMPALALTDHGNMYGSLEFYQKAKAAGIKPIVGYEAYVAAETRFQKGKDDRGFHLTLLAMNEQGYRNLIVMATKAFVEGRHYHPRIDKDLLKEYNEGIICLSGCMSSEFARTILRGNANQESYEKAKSIACWFREIFGDRYYIELQDHGVEGQKLIMDASIRIAKELGIPVVATNDVHYVLREDWEIQDLLLCISTGKLRTDANRMKMSTDNFYLKSGKEMLEVFAEYPEAISESVKIAERCDIQLELGKRFFPNFVPPDGKSSDDYLRELCLAGLKRRYAGNPKRIVNGELSEEVMARLNRELSVISKLGFPNYFLIVWDFVRFAEEHGIHRTARGSGVGALVCYALNLSHVCPLEFDLLFERFLDENRIEAPDIDIDFDKDRRGEVLEYVKEKYGENSVAQIGTFGTMAAKMAIKDVGRAMALPLNLVNEVTKLVPDAPKTTIEKARKASPELERLIETNSDVREMIMFATRMEGLVRSAGTHACAVVIADRPLTDFVPIQCMSGKEEFVTQYAAAEVEKSGLLKMDFLGLRNLSILSNSIKLIEKTHNQRINPYQFPLDDKESFAILCRGETKGIFQLESEGIREILVKMHPENFRDIIATIALYRPGPLGGGMVDAYIDIKHGRREAVYIHPVMKEVLEETNGIMVYQEQVMRIINRLGQVPLASAYSCIKAISKKKHEKIAKYKEDFINGASGNGLTVKEAEDVFALIMEFAGYGFNKSHSTAYALVAYMTAYLKAHYPAEFMASLLCGDISKRNFKSKDSTVEHLEDCEQMHIEIVYPDINVSFGQYSVQDGKLLFGLTAIKGVGDDAAAEIVRAREEKGPFKNIFDFYERIDPKIVPRGTMESLLKSGAFDKFGMKRSQLLLLFDKAFKSALSANEDRMKGQKSLFELLEEDPQTADENIDQDIMDGIPDIPEWDDKEKAENEKEVLGFYLTTHPLKGVQEKIKTFASHTIMEACGLPDRTNVILGGMISNSRIGTTKNKKEGAPNTYASFDMEDTEKTIRAFLWPQQYEIWGSNVQNGNMVIVTGRMEKSRINEGEANLIVDRLLSLEDAEKQLTRGVLIKIPETDTPEETVRLLYDILKTYRTNGSGSDLEISIRLRDGKTTLFKCPQFHVHINDEMKGRITERFGKDAFQLIAVPYRQQTTPEKKQWARKSE